MAQIPAKGGELREGLVGLPRTINPLIAVTDVDRDLSALVYAGLTKYHNGDIIPDIAKSLDISEDGLTYTFTLRDDVYFHDGEQLTAEDVVFTIHKIQDPAIKSPRRPDWADVIVNQIEENKVEFILKKAYSPFLTNTTIGILPKHVWGSVGNEQFIFSQYNIQPIGAGPFRLRSVSYDDGGIPVEYRLSAWNKYHGETPYVYAIRLSFFADQDNALDALNKGLIDSLAVTSSLEAFKLASNTAQGYEVITAPLPRVFSVFFNQNQSSVLADTTVRKALDLAINRKVLIEEVLNGFGTPIFGPLPGITGDSIEELSTGDIEDAHQILEDKGWIKNSDGIFEKKSGSGTKALAFELYTADSPDLKHAAESIKSMWSALGADVTIKVFESGDLYQNVIRTRKYDALLFGQFIGKDRDLYAFWHSSQRNAPGLNVALYANSRADKLLEDIRSTHSESVLVEKYNELDKIIRDELPAIFLYVPDFVYVIPKNLKGVSLGSVTIPADRWNSVSSWHLHTDNVWKFFAQNN